ncbi:MAG: EAL domain-containing protein, partial [Sutterella wadsworthensis]
MYANNTTLNSGQLSGRRSWFVEQTESRLARGSYECAIVSIDVCDFKIINLIFGHAVGDRMLGYIYNAISASLEPDEIVVRDTADVFYAFFHTKDKQAILERLGQIRRNLDALVLVDAAYSPYLEMRFGVYLPTGGEETVELMLELANMARKHSPRELIVSEACFYNPDRVATKLQEKERIAHLIEALEQRQFIIHLQPKVSLSTQKIVGAEALVRWNRPGVGVVSPGEFIPLLERYRLVHR